jgi:hypothetical protein
MMSAGGQILWGITVKGLIVPGEGQCIGRAHRSNRTDCWMRRCTVSQVPLFVQYGLSCGTVPDGSACVPYSTSARCVRA